MRLAIFGGTFDPPHVGHLLAASDAIEQLGLDRLVLVPAATQPLKVGQVVAAAEHRLAMARLTVEGDARFEVSTVEIDRAGLSFMVDTLTHFAARYPAAELLLLLGTDVLGTFAQWREPQRIIELAKLVILDRSSTDEGWAALPGVNADAMRAALLPLSTRRVDVSSTEIRERVRGGKSIRGFVTDKVAAYIARHRLYR